MAEQALSGIKVIDFGRYIAGPFAAMLLAEQGADVIKVESPQGDPCRCDEGFMVWNRSKRAITIDLKAAAGRDVAIELVKTADVVIENSRPGIMDRLGLGYQQLRAVNQRLVYCSISGFGQAGPYSRIPGYEPVVSSIAGVYKEQGVSPLYLVAPLASFYTAVEAAYDIVAALYIREKTGCGQKIDLSMLRSMLGAMRQFNLIFSGQVRTDWNTSGPLPLFCLYQAADGKYFFLSLGNYKFVTMFCIAMGHEEWLEDPLFENAPFLILPPKNTQLRARLTRIFKTRKRHEWLKLFEDNGIPAAPVLSVRDFMRHRQVRANNMVELVDQPGKGKVFEMGVPVTLAGAPGHIKGPAPLPGQDSGAILKELGFGVEDIRRLKHSGAVK